MTWSERKPYDLKSGEDIYWLSPSMYASDGEEKGAMLSSDELPRQHITALILHLFPIDLLFYLMSRRCCRPFELFTLTACFGCFVILQR